MGKISCPLGHKFELSSLSQLAEKLGKGYEDLLAEGPFYSGGGIEKMPYPYKELLTENRAWRDKLKPEEGKWVSLRTLREQKDVRKPIGRKAITKFSYDFDKEPYAVCPSCGVVFRPRPG